jgi:hypothetical protein
MDREERLAMIYGGLVVETSKPSELQRDIHLSELVSAL